MQLLVDGQVLHAQQLDHGLQYDGVEMQLGAGYNESLMGAVTNFRIWNYARTAEQLKQDWSRNLAENTPGLLLDYRFDSQEAQTIRDHSPYGHHGRRFAEFGPNPRIVDGLTPVQFQDFTIQVEDGRGGTARQTFRINVVPVVTGSVTGTIFEDLNKDGQPGPLEPGLTGWTLYLDKNDNSFLDAMNRKLFHRVRSVSIRPRA